MADWTFATLQSAVGIATTHFSPKSQLTQLDSDIETSNGTISIVDLNLGVEFGRSVSYQRGKRPGTGQLFPRGVYNK